MHEREQIRSTLVFILPKQVVICKFREKKQNFVYTVHFKLPFLGVSNRERGSVLINVIKFLNG